MRVLYHFRQDRVTERLLELAGGPLEPELRSAAIVSLRDRYHPGIFHVLQDVLAGENTSSRAYRSAFRTLNELRESSRDPAVAAYFASLQPPQETDTLRCGSDDFSVDAPASYIVTPGNVPTARCWSIPHREVALDRELQSRMDASFPVSMTAFFEVGGVVWVQLDHEDCWVPRSSLVWGSMDEAEIRYLALQWQAYLDSSLEREINDIPTSELESETARTLLGSGFLSLFDPLDQIIGAEISVRTNSYEDCLALLATYPTDETYLGRMVHDLVNLCVVALDQGDPRWGTFMDSRAERLRAARIDTD